MRELDFIRRADTSAGDGQTILKEVMGAEGIEYTFQLYNLHNESFAAVEEIYRSMGMPQENIELSLYLVRQRVFIDPEVCINDMSSDNPHKRIPSDQATALERIIHLAGRQIIRKEYAAAAQSLEDALLIDPNEVLAWANKAVLANKTGNKKQALEFFNKALSIDPDRVEVLIKKMDFLISYPKARLADFTATVDALLKNQPEHPAALHYKFQLCFWAKDIPESLKYAKRYYKDNYYENITGWPLCDVLMVMPEMEAMEELDKFAAEATGIALKTRLEEVKKQFLSVKAWMETLPGGAPIIFL